MVFAFVASMLSVGLNAENLSDKQFNQLAVDCLDNENISSCQRLIDSDRLESVEQCDKETCNNIGRVYYGAKNYQQASKYFKKACDLNYMVACHNVGVLYAEGKGVKQDFVNARKYYEKACNANVAEACNNLGVLYVNGQGVKQNLSTAKKYYGKACDLNEKISCEMYKMLDMNGVSTAKSIDNFDEPQNESGEKSAIWTILFGLLDKVLTFALSFLVVGGFFKVLLWGAWKVGLAKNKDLFANKTATSAYIILSVLVAILGPKMLARALYAGNMNIIMFVFAFLFGFGICALCYYICHKIFFKFTKINENLLYAYGLLGGILCGIAEVKISFDIDEFFLYTSIYSFCIIFIVFLIAKPIATPLPAEVYNTEKNLVAVRLIKVLFILSFILALPTLFMVTIPAFFILWGVSYIAFGSGNPFFVFKYKPNQRRKKDNTEYIDTEIVE